MSFNLIRNARVFFTTNLSATGVVNTTGFDNTNTREIQVLDGLSFSQETTSETITLNEAGATPARGQRQFNTALNPVDFSMSTYMRPIDQGATVTCEESVLWNAMFGAIAIGTANAAWTNGSLNAAATCVATNSNVHQLQRFGLIITIDGTSFVIDDCVLNTATIDFGLDAIATIQWAGQGKALRQIDTPTFATATSWTGTLTGSFLAKITAAAFIANKLSTITIDSGITVGTGTAYTLALTGGSLTITNNITYLTPANLGIVNEPATYFTGTRGVTGTLNCYLRTGSGNSAGLLSTLLANKATDIDPEYSIRIAVGGAGADRVEFEMPGVVLAIPSVNTEQVVSTAINFTAQGTTGSAFDLTAANEINIKYYATNVA
jgi:hypothetical protein